MQAVDGRIQLTLRVTLRAPLPAGALTARTAANERNIQEQVRATLWTMSRTCRGGGLPSEYSGFSQTPS